MSVLRRPPFKKSGFWPVPLITPSIANQSYFQKFMDTRTGYGAHAMDDYGLSYTNNVLFVTTVEDNGSYASPTPGSLRAACKVVGPKIIRFAPGLSGHIAPANRTNITCNSNTIIDGYGFTGTIKCGLNGPGNISNIVFLNLSIHEPFVYGDSPSNKQVITFSNTRNAYMRWCTIWDGGDAIIASGAYSPQNNASPYTATIEECIVGPSPGEYAYMSPIKGKLVDKGQWAAGTAYAKFEQVTKDGLTWTAAGAIPASDTFSPNTQGWVMPGLNNAIDNDARNGKLLNSAVDHNYLDSYAANHTADEVAAETSKYEQAFRFTVINNIFQGGVVRGPKCSSQTMDVVGNLITKYGHPYRVVSGNSSNVGGGISCEGDAVMNIEGNVFIPKAVGEQVFAMPWSLADSYGVPRMTVDSAGSTVFCISQEGDKTGNAFIGTNNWFPGGITLAQAKTQNLVQPIKYSSGFSRSANVTINGVTLPGYNLSIEDVSTYAAANAKVKKLEAICGNSHSIFKPRYWRDTHVSSPTNFDL